MPPPAVIAANPEPAGIDPFHPTSCAEAPTRSIVDDRRFKCVMNGTIAYLMGAPSAFMFAFLFPSVSIPELGLKEDASTWAKVKESWRLSAVTARQNAPVFARMGLMWAGSECVLETVRGKSDMYNGVTAGCFTGGVLAIGGGPAGMAMGCLGMGAFGFGIDAVMHNMGKVPD
eukprot:TRINITY_DN8346_c0_g1_i1.p1 TRINITY_DN8346_c0_g1~~TRINITY_DN8346_c0_g1_i1.p1  ORF type:complete len:173 (+),score=35.81 TRINITY_DN8346_c0_g1_i1:22-540(+)